MVDHIGDDAHPDLPDLWKTVIGWADVVIGATPRDDATSQAVRSRFTRAELAELTLTIAMAQGFSKAAIAWGPAPEIPVTEIPTPGT